MVRKKVVMCGSALSAKGGMVSVIKNYLQYTNWGNINIKYVPTHIEAGRMTKAIYFCIAFCKIVFLMLRGKIDVLYLHTAERGSFFRKAFLARTAKLLGIKIILHHHAAEFEDFYIKLSRRKKNFVKETLEMVDLNIVLSDQFASVVTAEAPCAKVKILYNAVYTNDVNLYHIEARNILFLGELGKRKGVYDLLAALKELDQALPEDINVYLCGNGEIKEVKERISNLDIGHRIAHVGWIDGEKKNEIFSKTMINVLPSYNEGMPMTILETMAYGIPNISTSISSIPEVIDNGKNGIVIEPGNVEQLKNAIYRLATSPGMRRLYSENAWQKITNLYSIDGHIAKVKEYLQNEI